MTKIVNLTPYTIVVRIGETEKSFPTSGTIARVTSEIKEVGTIAGIPVKSQIFSEVEGLPKPEERTVYIVFSELILSRAKEAGRTDVVTINTTEAYWNERNKIVVVPGFIK